MFDDILEGSPFEKLLDILQHCPRGALENAMRDFFVEYHAMLELLEQKDISEQDIKHYIFNNEARLEEEGKYSLSIDLSARILGQEG